MAASLGFEVQIHVDSILILSRSRRRSTKILLDTCFETIHQLGFSGTYLGTTVVTGRPTDISRDVVRVTSVASAAAQILLNPGAEAAADATLGGSKLEKSLATELFN